MTGNNHKGIILQDRDRHLLRELALMRVIDREQAKCVAGFGSTTSANTRLLALTRSGLLHRFFLGTTAGGKKALYSLSPAGAKIVDMPFRGPRRKRDAVLVTDFWIIHQLHINQIYCALKYRPIPSLEARLLQWQSFYEPLDSSTRLIPDGYLEVLTPHKTIAAFLEVDLGHESLSVWKAKVQNYLRYAVSGNFETRFGLPQFRVLVLADSERRMQSLRAATSGITDKVFWFSTFHSITNDGFWSKAWLRASDEPGQSLL